MRRASRRRGSPATSAAAARCIPGHAADLVVLDRDPWEDLDAAGRRDDGRRPLGAQPASLGLNSDFACALRALNRPLAVRWTCSDRVHSGGNDHEAPSAHHTRARRSRVRRRRGHRGRRRQGAALPVPRRARERELLVRSGADRGRQPRRAQGADRPEPEPVVRARREDRDPRLVARHAARRRRRRPEAGRLGSAERPREGRRVARRHRERRPPRSSPTAARGPARPGTRCSCTSAPSPARSPAATSRCTSRAATGAALRSMLGQSLDQTFTYDDGTIFLLWQGRVPTVIDASQLKAGDRITVRVRAPRARDARAGRGHARQPRRRPRARRPETQNS